MATHRHLTQANQHTLQEIFQYDHPPIEWADLLHLVEEVGHVSPKGDGAYRLVVNGEGHTVRRPHHDKVTDPEDLTAIRALFERGRVTP